MKFRLLDLKTAMITGGVNRIDFLQNNLNINFLDDAIRIQDAFIVDEHLLCRPDIISSRSYGSADHVDVVLKFNQISNPFSMEIGDIIVTPTLESINKFYKEDVLLFQENENKVKWLFIDESKATKDDINRLKQVEKIAKRTSSPDVPAPTNLLRTSEKSFTFNSGEQSITVGVQ